MHNRRERILERTHLRNFLLVNFQHVPETFCLSSSDLFNNPFERNKKLRFNEFNVNILNTELVWAITQGKFWIHSGWAYMRMKRAKTNPCTEAILVLLPGHRWSPLCCWIPEGISIMTENVQTLNCLKRLLSQATLLLRYRHETFGWITSSSTFRFLLLFHDVDF